MKNKYDIKIDGNTINGRQGWAYICNSGEITVVKADLRTHQGEDKYFRFGKVRISYSRNGEERLRDATLVYDGEYIDWKLTSWGVGISASFTYHDALDLIDGATAPVIRVNEPFAVAVITSEYTMLKLFKVDRVDPYCTPVATLSPLYAEDMQEIERKANTWLNR